MHLPGGHCSGVSSSPFGQFLTPENFTQIFLSNRKAKINLDSEFQNIVYHDVNTVDSEPR